jgi:hypothetical protein
MEVAEEDPSTLLCGGGTYRGVEGEVLDGVLVWVGARVDAVDPPLRGGDDSVDVMPGDIEGDLSSRGEGTEVAEPVGEGLTTTAYNGGIDGTEEWVLRRALVLVPGSDGIEWRHIVEPGVAVVGGKHPTAFVGVVDQVLLVRRVLRVLAPLASEDGHVVFGQSGGDPHEIVVGWCC